MISAQRRDAIRAARSKAGLERENVEKRETHAGKLVQAMNENLGTRLNVPDFGRFRPGRSVR